jgi:hypothetical protein
MAEARAVNSLLITHKRVICMLLSGKIIMRQDPMHPYKIVLTASVTMLWSDKSTSALGFGSSSSGRGVDSGGKGDNVPDARMV